MFERLYQGRHGDQEFFFVRVLFKFGFNLFNRYSTIHNINLFLNLHRIYSNSTFFFLAIYWIVFSILLFLAHVYWNLSIVIIFSKNLSLSFTIVLCFTDFFFLCILFALLYLVPGDGGLDNWFLIFSFLFINLKI